ncbi:MAG: hypothetical protein ACI4PO_09210 [Faecousia sp.]
MNAKEILLKAARKKRHKDDIQRMTEAEASELLMSMRNKKE